MKIQKLKINGLLEDSKITWKKLKCKCDKSDIEKCFPIFRECIHCYAQDCENSMPRKVFDVIVTDKKGKQQTKTITEITIDRTNDGFQMIRGWSF